MFTGIIQQLGSVKSFDKHDLVISAAFDANAISVGDSVAVNGCCQTVTEITAGALRFHVLDETLKVTNLSGLQVGDKVNLELAMRLGDRFGGHLVSGHIDCTTEILSIDHAGDDIQLMLRRPDHQTFPLIHRGSVAVNGISLTVALLAADRFAVKLIPHTWNNTNMNCVRVGARVNLEADMMGKYVAQMLRGEENAPSSRVTIDMLKDAGF